MDVNRANIEVHIDEVALDGVADVDQARLAAVTQRELLQLIAQGSLAGMGNRRGSETNSGGGAPTSSPTHEENVIGGHIAQAVNERLTR